MFTAKIKRMLALGIAVVMMLASTSMAEVVADQVEPEIVPPDDYLVGEEYELPADEPLPGFEGKEEAQRTPDEPPMDAHAAEAVEQPDGEASASESVEPMGVAVQKSAWYDHDIFDSFSGNESHTYPQGCMLSLEWDGSDEYITSWKSSDNNVVQIALGEDLWGELKLLNEGTAVITAKLNTGRKCKYKIKVVDALAPTGIEIYSMDDVNLHKKTVTCTEGTIVEFYAITLFDNAYLAEEYDMERYPIEDFDWSSSNSAVASVDEGSVTCHKKGTARISVTTDNGMTQYCKVKVIEKAKPKSVSLNYKGTVELQMGGSLQLTPFVSPSGVRTSYTWSSSKPEVATVSSSGLVQPKAEGKTTVTVKAANGKKASVKVKVYDPNAPQSIVMDEKSITMKARGTRFVRYTIYPSTATQKVTFKSSNPDVVFVDSNGIIAGLKKGSAKITVTTSNGLTATMKVKVTE
ncbi:MAG: Ig-like domain-containing protein [Clostridia bacterium]|nr:Ig-like domain-containing protein [Clostridia bacterium]